MSEFEDSLDGIAVIGMSGRFPGAGSIEQFWLNLRNGVESIHRFTDQELETLGVTSELYNHPNYVKAGTVLENAYMFDAEFFGFYPREAEIHEPQHRVLLECAWEALESAGYDVESCQGQIGVFAGCSPNYYGRIIPFDSDPVLVAEAYQREIANEKDYLCTLVAYKLGLKGPAMTIQTACSTSLVAVCMACQSLMTFQCDVALAGGVCVNTRQRGGYFYQEGLIPSPDGHCRAFDAKAQGTVLSQGSGVVVLKRLSEAFSEGDKIYAVIKGFAVNNDGSDKVGFTAPSVNGQAEVIAMAQALSGFSPETITYIEAHGTGTFLGDPIEMAALNKVFREYTDKTSFCATGSLKTNVGHMDAAAGVAGLIKTVLMLEHREIPPSLHFERPNPEIDFDHSPFYVNTKLTKWVTDGLPLRAGVSAFGLGGTNAHVVLEEAPERDPSGPSRPRQLLTLSARTKQALDAATANLKEYLSRNPAANIADVAYTLQTGRKAFNHRRFVVCEDAKDAAEALKLLDPNRVKTRLVESRSPEVAFMFPGQGAQYVNMGLNLYEHETLFRKTIDRCAEILEPSLELDLREVLYPKDGDREKAADALRKTGLQQPALFMIEYALAKLWEKWGVRPGAMIGHSIGEYVAACLADVFSLEEALRLVATRGRMMQGLPGGAMLSVRLPAEQVEPELNANLTLAAVNAPSLCVVSGPTEAVQLFQADLEKQGVMCRFLHTSHAFHSPMMDSIVEPFAEKAKAVQFSPPKIPFVSTMTGTWITPAEATDPIYWGKQLRHTVRFAEGIRTLWERPERVLLEIGPRTTSTTLARQQARDKEKQVAIPSLGDTADNHGEWSAMLNAVGQLWSAGVSVDWAAVYEEEKRHRVRLPTYPFERRLCWIETEQRPVAGSTQARRSTSGGLSQAPCTDMPKSVRMVDKRTDTDDNRRPPQNEVERKVASMFQELLGVKEIWAQDNFFDLGGDSLIAAQLLARIEKVFNKKLRPPTLYEAQTVEQLSNLLSESPAASIHVGDEAIPYAITVANLTGNKPDILGLWKRNLQNVPEERYSWIYENNPFGPAACFLAKDKRQGSIVGAAASFPRPVFVNGRRQMAGLGGDFAVDIEHRMLAPAVLLQNAVISSCSEGKFDLLYGFPNRQAEAVSRMLGYKIFDVLTMTKPLKSYYYLKRRSPFPWIPRVISKPVDLALKASSKETRYRRQDRFNVETLSSCDDRFDRLWEEAVTRFPIIGERSRSYLNWRYIRAPHQAYRVFALTGEGGRSVVGYIVFHIEENRTDIDDMLCPDMNEKLDSLLAEFLLFQRKEGIDSVSISYAGEKTLVKRLQQFGFSIRDRERKAIAYAPADSALLSCLSESENWYLLPGDNDV